MIWCMERTNIYLESRQTEALDTLAKSEGVSRAEIIRRLLDRAMNNVDDDLAAELEAINESFGALPDLEPHRRSPGDREAHLAQLWDEG